MKNSRASSMVFPAGNHHLQPWGKSIELCHQYGVKCYPSIDMPMFVNLPRLSRHATESYLARVAAAKQAGADGIFYYNLFNETHVRTVMALNDEAIRYADKRYHISPIVHWRPTHNLSTGEKITPCRNCPAWQHHYSLMNEISCGIRMICSMKKEKLVCHCHDAGDAAGYSWKSLSTEVWNYGSKAHTRYGVTENARLPPEYIIFRIQISKKAPRSLS